MENNPAEYLEEAVNRCEDLLTDIRSLLELIIRIQALDRDDG